MPCPHKYIEQMKLELDVCEPYMTYADIEQKTNEDISPPMLAGISRVKYMYRFVYTYINVRARTHAKMHANANIHKLAQAHARASIQSHAHLTSNFFW